MNGCRDSPPCCCEALVHWIIFLDPGPLHQNTRLRVSCEALSFRSSSAKREALEVTPPLSSNITLSTLTEKTSSRPSEISQNSPWSDSGSYFLVIFGYDFFKIQKLILLGLDRSGVCAKKRRRKKTGHHLVRSRENPLSWLRARGSRPLLGRCGPRFEICLELTSGTSPALATSIWQCESHKKDNTRGCTARRGWPPGVRTYNIRIWTVLSTPKSSRKTT